MLRILRRAPWIAAGAAVAYYADGYRGGERRRRLLRNARTLVEHLEVSFRSALANRARSDEGIDAPLEPTVSDTNVETRASRPLPEETAAGVPHAATAAMAAQILAESERRLTERSHTAAERRRSEDTVAPAAR